MAISYKRGFTLIELLVVVAIIGLLASIVITSVSGARQKGIDTAVKGQLSNLRTMAEVFYGAANNSYDTFCGTTTTVTALKAAKSAFDGGTTVVTDDATGGTYSSVTCHDSATNWVAEAPLSGSVNNASKMWCVDSSGVSKALAANTNIAANALVCP